MAEREEELKRFRQEIDKSDKEIIRLLIERAEYAGKIGSVKRQEGLPVYRPDREKEVYSNILQYYREILQEREKQASEEIPVFPEMALRSVYREIMSGTIALEGGPRVAYLGPPGSFSNMAVRSRFGSSVEGLPVDTIPSVFRAVESGRDADYGVVPVENTAGGSVHSTLDMFRDSELKIYAEQYIQVNHHLLYHTEIPVSDIKKLYTIKIAREQCRDWLSANLASSQLEVIETSSTAAAAKMALEKKDGAAIASDLAAEIYGLKTLARNIQDSLNNLTRFLILGNHFCRPSQDDKTSILCSVQDQPGSLFEILKPFYEHGINLTKIESRTTRRSYGEYYFFIDFLGHFQNSEVADILEAIRSHTTFLKILGSYPRSDY